MIEKHNNTLVLKLKPENDNLIFESFNNIETYYNCSMKNLCLRLLKKIKNPLICLFYGKWKKKLQLYNTVILFDAGFVDFIPKYIKRKNKNIKIIFWYWNSLSEYGNKIINNKYIDEIWTYNRFDAEEFHIKYNPQFYYINLDKFYLTKKSKNNTTDIIFLGRDKGREKEIKKLQQIFESKNLNCDFHIVRTTKDFVNYSDYLSKLINTNCILDFNYYLPCGLTLRPFEAMYFRKKLITNNKDIINYKFYNNNNIFILGIDDIEKINDFINTPYIDIDDEVKEYYSYPAWLHRISNGIETKY